MKSRLYSLTTNRQEGQFIVNLAEILVSAGLVIGVAFQVQLFLQDYQFENYYEELKDVENALWEYRDITGYWPADCNKDGVVDIGANTLLPQQLPQSCVFDVRSQEAMLKVFTDLASVNMLDEDLRAKFADGHGHYMQLAHVVDGNLEAKGKNVLVAFDVSLEMAQWLDQKIDGRLAAAAGRVRLWGDGYSQHWPQTTDAGRVSIAYYIDSKI